MNVDTEPIQKDVIEQEDDDDDDDDHDDDDDGDNDDEKDDDNDNDNEGIGQHLASTSPEELDYFKRYCVQYLKFRTERERLREVIKKNEIDMRSIETDLKRHFQDGLLFIPVTVPRIKKSTKQQKQDDDDDNEDGDEKKEEEEETESLYLRRNMGNRHRPIRPALMQQALRTLMIPPLPPSSDTKTTTKTKKKRQKKDPMASKPNPLRLEGVDTSRPESRERVTRRLDAIVDRLTQAGGSVTLGRIVTALLNEVTNETSQYSYDKVVFMKRKPRMPAKKKQKTSTSSSSSYILTGELKKLVRSYYTSHRAIEHARLDLKNLEKQKRSFINDGTDPTTDPYAHDKQVITQVLDRIDPNTHRHKMALTPADGKASFYYLSYKMTPSPTTSSSSNRPKKPRTPTVCVTTKRIEPTIERAVINWLQTIHADSTLVVGRQHLSSIVDLVSTPQKFGLLCDKLFESMQTEAETKRHTKKKPSTTTTTTSSAASPQPRRIFILKKAPVRKPKSIDQAEAEAFKRNRIGNKLDDDNVVLEEAEEEKDDDVDDDDNESDDDEKDGDDDDNDDGGDDEEDNDA